MTAFWVTFTSRGPVCVEASDILSARREASAVGAVEDVRVLPYPGEPRLNPSTVPAFCHSPALCAGRSACPKNRACSE